MKKYIICLAAAALTLGFTACEDVPAPYGINDSQPDTPDTPSEDGVLIDAPLTSSLDGFTAVCTTGNYPFAIDGSYGYVKVTSYDSDSKVNNPAESWLVSPAVSTKDVEKAHVTFDYILRYANASELKTNYLVRFSKDYAGDPATATWTDVTFNPVQVADWQTWTTADVNVPAEFIGQENVVVALYYKTAAKAATWELKNFKLQAGEAASSGDDTQTVRQLPYSEAFATTLGGFKNYTTSGSGEWTIDYSTAKATGYDNTTKVTTAGTYYIVSPEITLEGQTAAHVAYEYILQYNKGDENQQVLISDSFNSAAPAEGWTLLKGDHTPGTVGDWKTFEKADINIPASYMGKKIRIAFRYNTNAESGSTWEVKNFSIAAGEAGGSTTPDQPSTPDTPDVPAGENIVTNGGFEAWTGSTPDGWCTNTSVSNATLSQSTDAHSGSSSVKVGFVASSNKRLASKLYHLEAGTYTMTFYVKGAGQVRPGYALSDATGAVTSSSYIYGSYATTAAGEWTLVTHEFTLDEAQYVYFVMMNPKKTDYAEASEKLVDDFSVVKK